MPTPTPVPYFGLFGGSADPLVSFLLDLIRGLVVLVLAIVLAGLGKRWAVRFFARSRLSLNVATLLGNLVQVLIVAIGSVTLLRSFGIDWASLLTILGAAGLALSLSMQDLLKNVIAGIYILMERPFRIGDKISVKDVTGTVQGIELRTTLLRTDEGLQVVVPNSIVLNEIVTNRSASDRQRQSLTVRVPQGNLSELSSAVTETLRGFEWVAASPAPVVALEGVVNGVARLKVEFWLPTARKAEMAAQVVEALRSRLPDANVTVV